MKILIAECRQEVSSFNPVNTGLNDFIIGRGKAFLDSHRGRRTEVGGALEVFAEAGVEVVGTYSAQLITSGGILAADAWHALESELLDLVRAGIEGVDGIYCALHGAMATTDELDPEGYLLQEIRKIAGPDIPIVASLDLHGILTNRMLENANAFAVYHTYPHEDFDSTGRRAARLLLKILRDDVKPVTAVVRIPALVRGDEMITASGKIQKTVGRCVQLEASGETLSAAMMWSNPFTDVPELCSLAIVTTDGDADFASHEALSLARTFWDDRADMQAELHSIDDALDLATGVPGTTVLVDAADATSSGASGDSNAILAAVLKRGFPSRGLFPIVDAPAVQAAFEAGIGGTITVPLGGTLDPDRFPPVEVTGRVKMLSDGQFRYESHGFGPADAGLTAVLEVGLHVVVVTSRQVSHFDRSLFLAHGQNPKDFDLVVQKSPHCPHYCFRDWAAQLIGVDAPGSTSANLPYLGHTICRRPMYPMELDTVFEPKVEIFRQVIEIPGNDEVWRLVDAWRLEPVGEPFATHSSKLLAAMRSDQPVMLKLTNYPEEIAGGGVLQWWGGDGAAPVLERAGNALLMERAVGKRSLYRQCLDWDDEGPILVLCDVLERLHAERSAPPPFATTLEKWFADLLCADPVKPEIARGQRIAENLLATQVEEAVLHGDMHHRNVLDFGDGRWLTIDPKGLFGGRTFDYVNIFRNPTTAIAADPARFRRRVQLIETRAGLDRIRLLEWIAAFCALSVCWGYYPDESEPDSDLAVLELALALLDESTT